MPHAGPVGICAALALSASAYGGALTYNFYETINMYNQAASHQQLVGPVDIHSPFPPNPPGEQFWERPVTLTGVVGPPDTITAVHQARHIASPHGEVIPAPWWFAPPISPPLRPYGVGRASASGKVDHPQHTPPHYDYYVEVLAAQYGGPQGDQIESYVYGSSGIHDPSMCVARGGVLSPDEVVPPPPPPPPGTPIPYGVVTLGYDGGTNLFVIGVIVRGVPQPALLGAAICVGAPGANGPPIFDLGLGWAWQDMGDGALVQAFLDVPFPEEWVPALVAEQTYVEIYTLEHPLGGLRGQLEAADEFPPIVTGDLNCDGQVNFGDINPFVLYLSNFSTWQTEYADCPPENGDINQDGSYPSFGDINPFVALLSGGG
jgi:hypothetical protein